MTIKRWIITGAVLLLLGAESNPAAGADIVPAVGSPFVIKVWGTADGLPQSSVISMIQTRDGYLWLGTLNGLVRFDGVQFTVFDESNTPGLGSSRIFHLFEDSRGNLWIGTETAGIVLVKGGRVISLDIGRGTRESVLTSACEDANGTVWLYTADGQLCRYKDGRVDVAEFGAQYGSACRRVIAEAGGPLWVGVDWGLYGLSQTATFKTNELPPLEFVLPVQRLDFLLASRDGGYWRLADGRVQKWRTTRLERDLGPYPWKSGAHVLAACEDRAGNLIVGTLSENDGVYWFGEDGKATHISRAEGLSHDGILSLCVDEAGDLWVGTDGGGLNRVKRRTFHVAAPTRDWVVQSAREDAQGGLWIASNGGGLGYWKDGALRLFGFEQGLADLQVRSVFVDREGRVWAGTFRGGLYQLVNDRFQQPPGFEIVNLEVSVIHQDRAGRLWFGTQAGLVRWDGGRNWTVFTTQNGLSANSVRALADDADGNLWIGTMAGGLNCMRDGRFTAFRKQADGLPSDNISSLLVDREGVLWVGTIGSGLARLSNGKWTRYTTRDGLISNSIGYMLEDEQGFLWIGSNAGLMRLPKKALNEFAEGLTRFIPCRVYGEPDGLPTSECTSGSQPAACSTRDGRLWFPTTRGLVFVDPARLVVNPHEPPVIIESVLIDDKLQNTNALGAGRLETVVVPARSERLEIHYTSLNLGASFPQRTRFQYRLEGHETDWTDAYDSRVARYPKLPPGTYRFEVRACNEDGVWSKTGSSLAVIVETPFWRTWWFLSASAVCILGMIVGIVHYFSTQKLQRQLERLRQQQAIERERSRIARDLHDQLGANLTQVSLLGELTEADKHLPDEVEQHARQITLTARETTRALDEIVWAANPANDTLEGLVTYACKYAQDYFAMAGLRYRLEVPEHLPNTPILPDVRHNVFLAFKEAVNNVVKHAGATTVRVRLRLDDNRFSFEIEDDGRGLSEADMQKGRSGLRNMRKRMEDVGGEFFIGPAPERGTLVRLSVPIGKR